MKKYKVGGAIRDHLLGLESKDNDFLVIGETPESMIAMGFTKVGKDFPVFLHPETGDEYALARTERKSGKGYSGFTCYFGPDVSVEDDLLRRDLTINAMAMSEDGTIIDPYGGAHDLNNKILRHVSDAFREDPLRVLRIARFHARYSSLGFKICPDTMSLMKSMVASGELNDLKPERVWLETTKSFKDPSPEIFIKTLRECGALKVVFPEIDALFGIPQNPKYHPEIDSGVHTLMVLSRAKDLGGTSSVLTAALLHDVGKAITPKKKWPSHVNHEKNGLPIVKSFCERFKIDSKTKDLALKVTEFHLKSHRIMDARPGTILSLLEDLDAFRRPEILEPFLLACQSDAQGKLGAKLVPYHQSLVLKEALAVSININGKIYAENGYKGKKVGELVRQDRVKAIKRAISSLKKDLSINEVSDYEGNDNSF